MNNYKKQYQPPKTTWKDWVAIIVWTLFVMAITSLFMKPANAQEYTPYTELYNQCNIEVTQMTNELEQVMTRALIRQSVHDLDNPMNPAVVPMLVQGMITTLIQKTAEEYDITECQAVELLQDNIDNHDLNERMIGYMMPGPEITIQDIIVR